MLRRSLLSLVSLVVAVAACRRIEPPPPAPPADFIVAAGDSVFWIRSTADGIHVRGAPMTLAVVDGRFAELYLTDDDHSFYDAVYVGQRLFKRDLISGDSLAVFTDTLMRLLARTYAVANPDEMPLAPDEQGSDNPRTIASADVVVLDLMGPWVSYEYRTDVDIIGGRSAHGIRRGVLDLRTGTPVTLDALFGRSTSRSIVAEGQRQWRELRDSLLVAAPDDLELREQFASLTFDPRSFTLGIEGSLPTVRFTATQSGARLASPSLTLSPITTPPPPWWDEHREAYPIEPDPSDAPAGERHWPRDAYTLIARPLDGDTPRVAFAIRDAGGQEWRLGSVPAPVLRVMWVEDATTALGTREALIEAFNAAAFYAEDTRIVERRTPRSSTAVRFSPVSLIR